MKFWFTAYMTISQLWNKHAPSLLVQYNERMHTSLVFSWMSTIWLFQLKRWDLMKSSILGRIWSRKMCCGDGDYRPLGFLLGLSFAFLSSLTLFQLPDQSLDQYTKNDIKFRAKFCWHSILISHWVCVCNELKQIVLSDESWTTTETEWCGVAPSRRLLLSLSVSPSLLNWNNQIDDWTAFEIIGSHHRKWWRCHR